MTQTQHTDSTETDDESAQTNQRVASAGSFTGRIVQGFLVLWVSFLYGFTKRVPKSGGISDAFLNMGLKMKKQDADMIVNVIYGDGVVIPRRGYWQSDKTSVETENGEEYSAEGIGFDPKRYNKKIPVVWALRDSSELTEPLEAAVATARKLGNFTEFTRADGEKDAAVNISAPTPQGSGGEAAVADGGTSPGFMEGRVVSFRDGYELFGSKVSQERLKDQEKRGKLAELENLAQDDTLHKLLIGGGGLVLGMFGPELAMSIAGGGGGGGGGGGIALPFYLLPGVLF